MVLRSAFIGVVASLLFASACTYVPRLQERAKRDDSDLPNKRVETTPIILTGRILQNESVGKSFASDYVFRSQLFKVHVRTINVLKGKIPTKDIDIFYFAEVGPIGGPARLGMRSNVGTWQIGDQELFFLQPEENVLRTICDYKRACVLPVYSGDHIGFQRDTSKPLTYAIVQILLTRGQHASDLDMVKAIQSSSAYFFSPEYTLERYRELSKNQSPIIQKAACDQLKIWGDRSCS